MTSHLPASIPGLGPISANSGLLPLAACSDGRFIAGQDGVASVTATGDRKVEFIAFADHTLAYVRSALGYPAYYPVHPVALERPVQAVLMDLDGTSVHSEGFWIWIIERTTASLLGNPASSWSRPTCRSSPATASPSTWITASASTARTRRSRRRATSTSSTHAARCRRSSMAAAAPMRLCPRLG